MEQTHTSNEFGGNSASRNDRSPVAATPMKVDA
jgi:hypothetical protein